MIGDTQPLSQVGIGNTGKLTVYCGPMFAGKSSSLIAELELACEEGKRVLVIKPKIDNRYSDDDIISHDGVSLKDVTGHEVLVLDVDACVKLEDLELVDLLLIEEAHFFTSLHEQIKTYMLMGVDIVAVGLDMDSDGEPFGIMPHLLSMASNVYKLTGLCAVCQQEATMTFRKLVARSMSQVLVGGSETYEPRCFAHWVLGNEEKRRWYNA
jgi:thymidine kinase